MKSTEVTVKVNVSLSRLEDDEPPAMVRKLFVGGNWKMNGSFSHIDSFFETVKNAETDSEAGN